MCEISLIFALRNHMQKKKCKDCLVKLKSLLNVKKTTQGLWEATCHKSGLKVETTLNKTATLFLT